MRSREQVLLVLMLAALALGSVGLGSASAFFNACKKQVGGKNDYVCIRAWESENKRLAAGESESFATHLAAGKKVALTWNLGEAKIQLSCETMSGTGSMTSGGLVQVTRSVKLEHCTEPEHRCKVARFNWSPNEETGGRLHEAAVVEELSFLSETGEFSLENIEKCPEKGTFPIEGGGPLICTMHGVEVEQTTHTQTCEGQIETSRSTGVPVIKIAYEDVMELSGTHAGKPFSIYLGP